MSGVIAHKHPSDFQGAKIGMWLFLFTEVLLFGGLFLTYAIYRSVYPADFAKAHEELNVVLGAINTIVLLTSSLTVVLAIVALQKGSRNLSIWMIIVTVACALIFMVNKYFEWSAKIHHGLYPGSETLISLPHGEIVFFNLYYVMTGLHGVHVIVGLVVFGFMLYFIGRRPVQIEQIPFENLVTFRGASKLAVIDDKGESLGTVADLDAETEWVDVRVTRAYSEAHADPRNLIKLENAGLYWHIVDIIWIFLFPLFYLIA